MAANRCSTWMANTEWHEMKWNGTKKMLTNASTFIHVIRNTHTHTHTVWDAHIIDETHIRVCCTCVQPKSIEFTNESFRNDSPSDSKCVRSTFVKVKWSHRVNGITRESRLHWHAHTRTHMHENIYSLVHTHTHTCVCCVRAYMQYE